MILQVIDNINFREYVLYSIEIQLKDRNRDYIYALEERKMKILFSIRIKNLVFIVLINKLFKF